MLRFRKTLTQQHKVSLEMILWTNVVVVLSSTKLLKISICQLFLCKTWDQQTSNIVKKTNKKLE